MSFQTPHIWCFFVLRCLIYKVHAPTAEHVIDYHGFCGLSTGFDDFTHLVSRSKSLLLLAALIPPFCNASRRLAGRADQLVVAHQQQRDLRAGDRLRRVPDALILRDEALFPRPSHRAQVRLADLRRVGIVLQRRIGLWAARQTVQHGKHLLARAVRLHAEAVRAEILAVAGAGLYGI